MNHKGFTLIELVIIIILIGIIAVVVAPKLGDVTTTKASSFRDKLKADIRYAQNLAMSQNRRYRVYFNTAPAPNPGYAVVNDANGNGTWGEAGEIAMDPAGGGNLSVTLNAGQYAGISITAVGFAGNYVEFDSLGRPYDSGGLLAVSQSVTVTGGSSVTVSPQTGAVN